MDIRIDIGWALAFLPAAARAAGLCLAAPVFGETAVPVKLRVLLALGMAVAATGRLAQGGVAPAGGAQLAGAIATELALGAALGYAARLAFVGIELGAWHIGQQMGIGLGEVFDPMAEETSGSTRRLYWLLAVAAFLSLGGHRALIGGLRDSFRAVPAAGLVNGPVALATVTGLLQAGFAMALKVAAPVLIALLLSTVALGVLQRTVPQLHLLSVGLPVQAMLGLLMLALGIAVVAPLMEAGWAAVARAIAEFLASPT